MSTLLNYKTQRQVYFALLYLKFGTVKGLKRTYESKRVISLNVENYEHVDVRWLKEEIQDKLT